MHRSVEYLEYLASLEWQGVRARIFATRPARCERCGTFGCRLDLHHKTYRNFGHERDEDLEVLCRECHELEHARRSRSGILSAMASAQHWKT
jgi:5-methylcytosine-specific restriction endonuclease McrA